MRKMDRQIDRQRQIDGQMDKGINSIPIAFFSKKHGDK